MKNLNHYSYLRGSGVVEVTVRDQSGAKLDKFTANINDYKSQKAIGDLLREKYNIHLNPEISLPIKQSGFFDS